MVSMICSMCGADWEADRFTGTCAECGGGALSRPCPLCGGRCGAIWQRAVVDSVDRREAHWIGHCTLAEPAPWAALQDLDRVEWWLDESALPDLAWAALVDRAGETLVIDADGRPHPFPDHDRAAAWLREDEYDTLTALQESGAIGHHQPPPARH